MMVILASTVITMFITSVQLWFDYRTDIDSRNHALAQVELSYGSSLSFSLWTYDDNLVRSQLDGITSLTEIEWAEIVSEDGSSWSAGDRRSTYTLQKSMPLLYGSGMQPKVVGRLTLVSSVDDLYWSLARKFAVILALNLVKTLCMSLVIIYLFYRIVGRHLIDLAAYLSALNLTDRKSDFVLHDRDHGTGTDELDQLAAAINDMRANLHGSYDEIARYRDELETALAKERELNGLQRQFVSMVSHEFRTPLAIIDGNAQRILRKLDKMKPEALKDTQRKVRIAVNRLTELMESVLSSSRLEEGRIAFEPKACEPARLLQEIAGNYRELSDDHEIIVDVENLPGIILADGKLLHQVFSNLLSNAIKYSGVQTRIWVTGRRDGRGDLIISVRDEGVGIPAPEIERLFTRFFRASTSIGITGTGIGLNLVSHLVDMHGGRIEVMSEVGTGTEFLVHLPYRAPPAISGPEAA